MLQRGCGEPIRQRPVLEVYWAELHVSRDRDSAFYQMFVLDLLTLGMVDLEDAKPCRPARLAVGECIHPGTEQHILPDTIGDGLSERKFNWPGLFLVESVHRNRHSRAEKFICRRFNCASAIRPGFHRTA